MLSDDRPLITTIKDACRVCYTCVRECPAKAIRINDRQAEIVQARCIGCGNCVRVCRRGAKQAVRDIDRVRALLAGPERVAAIVAPSFPAEFPEHDHRELVAAIRWLGFDQVHEVAFGADIVARAYSELLAHDDGRQYIGSTCPSIVAFVERYHPELVDRLAPIVSPMVAMARAVKRLTDGPTRIVFIGPCLAKKSEKDEGDDVDLAITFRELREMMSAVEMDWHALQWSDFDPPHAGAGSLFPIGGGMLQAAGIPEDLVEAEVIAAEGNREFPDAIREFAEEHQGARLLEVLACNGCLMGSGMTTTAPFFRRRNLVSKWVRNRRSEVPEQRIAADLEACRDLTLDRRYVANDQRLSPPAPRDIEEILRSMGKFCPSDELNCGACGYPTCREHAVAISEGLAESEMCLPFTIERLGRTNNELTATNEQLANAQQALLHAEKLASMGQLAAGIAHEVNNPLSTILMLSHLLLEHANGTADPDSKEDLELIASEADRCRTIVAGLLHFARKNRVEAARVDARDLLERTVLALGSPADVHVHIEAPKQPVYAEIDGGQVLQVLTNIAKNAVHAMPDGGRLTLGIEYDEDELRFLLSDTGSGIPEPARKRIFEPFFTTKPTGQGTGLGLSVSYGIVKMHHGDIAFETNADPVAGPTGTTFRIRLPRVRAQSATAQQEQDPTTDPTSTDNRSPDLSES